MKRNDFTSDDTFGGPWTDDKLNIIQKYLSAYTIALKKWSFKKVYIDAFAGSGGINIKEDDGSLRQIKGSVSRAISIERPFDIYYFVELNKGKADLLVNIQKEHPKMDIRTINGDANLEIPKIIRNIKGMNAKGVIFLDPYNTNVEWNTIHEIGTCGCLDFWYLFPLSAFTRMLPKNGEVPEEWKSKISNLCGCNDNIWFNKFYQRKKTYQMSLFDQDRNHHLKKQLMLMT
jgi:three-Cys-motif partner protein